MPWARSQSSLQESPESASGALSEVAQGVKTTKNVRLHRNNVFLIFSTVFSNFLFLHIFCKELLKNAIILQRFLSTYFSRFWPTLFLCVQHRFLYLFRQMPSYWQSYARRICFLCNKSIICLQQASHMHLMPRARSRNASPEYPDSSSEAFSEAAHGVTTEKKNTSCLSRGPDRRSPELFVFS